jgi:PKD repeat protein
LHHVKPLDAMQPMTYTWDFGTGATTSHTYTVSGTLTVRVTAYNPCTPSGVSATPQDIEVAPLRLFLPLLMRKG